MYHHRCGGYEYEFVDPPNPNEICGICFLPVRDPQQTKCVCAKVYCRSCYDKQKNTAGTCPTCRQTFEVFPDQNMNRRVKGLRIKCISTNCQWVNELHLLDNHLKSCEYMLLPCVNGCGNKIIRSEAIVHQRNVCPLRQYTCEYCKKKGIYNEIIGPHIDECPEVVISCPNVGCETSSIRKNMNTHCSICPHEIIECPYVHTGCTFTSPRCKMEDHKVTSVEYHLIGKLEKQSSELFQGAMKISQLEFQQTEQQMEHTNTINTLQHQLNGQREELLRLSEQQVEHMNTISQLESQKNDQDVNHADIIHRLESQLKKQHEQMVKHTIIISVLIAMLCAVCCSLFGGHLSEQLVENYKTISTLQSVQSEQNKQLQYHTEAISTLQSVQSKQNKQLQNHTEAVSTLQSVQSEQNKQLQKHTEAVSTLQSVQSEQNKQLQNHTEAISTLQSVQSKQNKQLQNHTEAISTLQSVQSKQNKQLQNHTEAISTLQSVQSEQNKQLQNHTEAVSTLQSVQSEQNKQIQKHTGAVSTLQSVQSEQNKQLQKHTEAVSTLQSVQSKQNKQQVEHTEAIRTLQFQQRKHNQQQVEHTEAISRLQSQLTVTTKRTLEFQLTKQSDEVIKVNQFNKLKVNDESYYSPGFYTHHHGYKICLKVDVNGVDEGHVSVFLYLMKGEYDDDLTWPVNYECTITLLNQLRDGDHYSETSTYSSVENDSFNSRVVDGEIAKRGIGYEPFIAHKQLDLQSEKQRQYLMDDTLYFRVKVKTLPFRPWLV